MKRMKTSGFLSNTMKSKNREIILFFMFFEIFEHLTTISV